ncbi:MAG TPA: hypothetical protein VFA49_02760 [Chloroflexota bacterium]|jgi:hypothetical protein|nr:hypothetical protein [Chloroflexota bacterium]
MTKLPRPRWLGNLFAPAEDPRGGDADSASGPETQVLLAELRRSRAELSRLRRQIEDRAAGSTLASELAEEEDALVEAEQALLLSMDERQARRALRAARLYAAEAQLRADP